MSKLSPLLVLVTLFAVLLSLSGCGNKGDLFLESDAEAIEELEQAAEKLKKEKKEPAENSTQPLEN